MYRIIALLGIIVRFFLPNPFAPLGGIGEIINLCASGGFVLLSYGQVSLVYMSGSNPAEGSLLFTLMYVINTAMTYLVMLAYPNRGIMLVGALAYLIGSFFVLERINNRGI